MNIGPMWGQIIPYLHFGAAGLISLRVLTRRGLEPSSRLAWIMVVEALPVLGIAAYLLFGEVRMRRADRNRMADVRTHLSNLWQASRYAVDVGGRFQPVSRIIHAVGNMRAVRGNRAQLLPGDDSAIDRLVDAIGQARDHVHILFYIWLDDTSGRKLADAVAQAARRGVTCRVIVDALGSRSFVRSRAWRQMGDAGVLRVRAFPLGWPLISLLWGRLDLRNHRKIAVVDGAVGFTGSRNAADMAFSPKPRFAPWVDVFFRVEGPVVRQMQAVFLQDWMSYSGSDLGDMLDPLDGDDRGAVAQVLASGPDWRRGSLSDAVVTLIHAARDRLTVTTPYYIPDAQVQAALISAATRGVRVTLIVPLRNDSRMVGWVSEGFFRDLLEAGVTIMRFRPGLLHAKIITVDGRAALFGSANLDRRSFDLNYEMSVLWLDADLTAELDARQAHYIEQADELSLQEARDWSRWRRARGNLVALATPLL